MESIQTLQEKLDSASAHLKEEFSSIRGARPTPLMVEDIKVEYFGQPMAIKQLGSISIVPPREVQIQVWDGNATKPTAKAVEEKLGIQTAIEGNTIHCNLPPLTQERKEELAKIIKQKAEEMRIRARVARDETKKEIETQEDDGDITEDEKKSMMDAMQKAVDAFNKGIDQSVEAKMTEIDFA